MDKKKLRAGIAGIAGTLAALALGALLAPAPALAATADLRLQKNCALVPSAGPQGVVCNIDVQNMSGTPSGSPVTITDSPSAPPGTLFTSSSGSFNCSTPTGPAPALITCAYNGAIPGSVTGSLMLKFKLPPGTSMNNCAKVTQGGGVVDPNNANNGACSQVSVPGGGTGGSITIFKFAQPQDPQDFAFTANLAAIAPFSLDDDPSNNTLPNSKTFPGLPAGTYVFTEGVTPGWTLMSIQCAPAGAATINLAGRSASINLQAGMNVTCRYTNKKDVATAQSPDISVTKMCTVATNRTITCSIGIKNNGSVPTTMPITLTDTMTGLPPNTQYLGGAGAPITCPPPSIYSQPISCTITTPIPGGQTYTYIISIRPPVGTTFQNCAKATQAVVAGVAPEANLANNQVCINFQVF